MPLLSGMGVSSASLKSRAIAGASALRDPFLDRPCEKEYKDEWQNNACDKEIPCQRSSKPPITNLLNAIDGSLWGEKPAIRERFADRHCGPISEPCPQVRLE